MAIVAIRGSTQIAHGTGTRGAGAVLAALVFAAACCGAVTLLTTMGNVDGWRVPRPLARGAGALAIVALLVGGIAVGPRIASRAWNSFRAPVAQTTSDPTSRLSNLSGTRYPTWQASVKAFQAHPVEGTGAGTFEFWWNQHGTNAEFVRDVHNIWLENLAELGLPGLLLIVALAASALGVVVAVLRRVRRNRSAGAAAAFAGCVLGLSVARERRLDVGVDGRHSARLRRRGDHRDAGGPRWIEAATAGPRCPRISGGGGGSPPTARGADYNRNPPKPDG